MYRYQRHKDSCDLIQKVQETPSATLKSMFNFNATMHAEKRQEELALAQAFVNQSSDPKKEQTKLEIQKYHQKKFKRKAKKGPSPLPKEVEVHEFFKKQVVDEMRKAQL